MLNFHQENSVDSFSISLCIILQHNFLRILKNDRFIMVLVDFTAIILRITLMSHTNYNRTAFMDLPDRLSFTLYLTLNFIFEFLKNISPIQPFET